MVLSLDDLGDARAVLIAGPTASGKSELALRLADAAGRAGRRALIVNADSMQVYDALRVLTARPSAAEEALVQHRLYGHVPAETRYSVGAWLGDVQVLLADAEARHELPIVVGGTGLYFKALTEGLAAVPPVPPKVRAYWSDRLAADGLAALHAHLSRLDPAHSVRPSDRQRILRALEVVDATGRTLADWQRRTPGPIVPADGSRRVVIDADRQTLARRIALRLERMIGEGALDEVAALLGRGLDPRLPAMKALGVKELAAVIRNEVPLEEAIVRMETETRRYAKRQSTWFRNQVPGWRRIAV